MSEANNYIAQGESLNIECRACLQIMNKNSVLYHIFDGWTPPWDGMESSIAEDLEKLANIQIMETDNHSKMICETCCQLLLAASNFAAIVRKSDEILRQRTQESKEINDRIWPKPIQLDKSLPNMFKDSIEIKQEVLSDEDEQCPSVNGSCHSNMDEMPNLDIVKVEPEEMIQQLPIKIEFTESLKELKDKLHKEYMDKCDKTVTNGNTESGHDHSDFTSVNSDVNVNLDVNVKEEPLSEDESELQQDMPLECLLCAKSFNSVTGLKAHVISQHSYKTVKRKNSTSMSPEKKKCKYICAICRRTFTTSTDLMVHETCHNKSVCYGCNESFDTFEQLTAHRRTCKAISSTVTKLKTLDDVLRPQPQETKELKCKLCDDTFSDPYYLDIHQEILHNIEMNGNNFSEDEDNI